MVGLSIVLESHKGTSTNKNQPQVINKVTMIKQRPTQPPPAGGFLDRCFLCSQKLLPGKDIYMYKGDRAFCSVECRCRQILMDEEQGTTSPYNRDSCCSSAAMKPPRRPTSSSSSSSRTRKGPGNRTNGFAY